MTLLFLNSVVSITILHILLKSVNEVGDVGIDIREHMYVCTNAHVPLYITMTSHSKLI